jgi:glucose/arabinose dehydrogenase
MRPTAVAAVVVALTAGALAAERHTQPGPGAIAQAATKAAKGPRLNLLARFDKPIYAGAPAGAGKLAYVVERAGRIKLLRGERKLPGAFLDISGRVSCCEGERGLISVAFAPDYERSRRFYVFFTNKGKDIEVAEFKRSRNRPLRASRGSHRKLLEIPLRRFPTHDGGQLAFGPDRNLYISTGDGGSFERISGNSQRKDSLLGKILRIDPTGGGRRKRYGIPRSNPYVGEKGANEIFARGLRNPWRFSFDGSRMLIADVGHERREEVDAERVGRARGANFGWDVFEGSLRFRPGSIAHHNKPIHEYSIGGKRCSIVGGYVVRDPRLGRLRGRYLYGDYCSGEIRALRPRLKAARGDMRLNVPRKRGIVSFGEDARERIYVVVLDSGAVYRLDPG